MADANMIQHFVRPGIVAIGIVLTNKLNNHVAMPKRRISMNAILAAVSTLVSPMTILIPIMDMLILNWSQTVSKDVFLITESDASYMKENGHVI